MKRKVFVPAKRKENRRRVLFYASIALGAVFLAGGFYVGIFSDVPKVVSIEVYGNRLVGKEDIIREVKKEMANAEWWRSILGEGHILFWRSGALRNISTSLTKLRAARVVRDIWKRKVVIEAREEEAIGVWCVPEGRCFVFNEMGILFAEAPEVRGYLITKIMGEEGIPVSIGDEVLGNARWFQNIRKTIEEVEEAGMRAKTARMQDRGKKEWSIEVAGGQELLFGFEVLPGHVGLILKELAKNGEVRAGRIIDFRVPEKVYVR